MAGDDAAAAAFDVGRVGRKGGTEHQYRIARIEKGLAEELLEDFRPRSDDYVFMRKQNAVFLLEFGRHCIAKAHQAQRRAVMRLIVVDRLVPRVEGARGAIEWAVADLQFDDVFALVRASDAWRRRGHRRRFRVERPRANWLKLTVMESRLIEGRWHSHILMISTSGEECWPDALFGNCVAFSMMDARAVSNCIAHFFARSEGGTCLPRWRVGLRCNAIGNRSKASRRSSKICRSGLRPCRSERKRRSWPRASGPVRRRPTRRRAGRPRRRWVP